MTGLVKLESPIVHIWLEPLFSFKKFRFTGDLNLRKSVNYSYQYKKIYLETVYEIFVRFTMVDSPFPSFRFPVSH